MKNDDQMFQSVLSRRNEYRERKNKRIRTIRRTVPVLACFCLTIAFGVGYWDHFRNLPHIPVQPNIIEEPTSEIPEITTTASTDSNTTISSGTPSEPASTTAPFSNSETERITSSAGVQTQTVTTVATDATDIPTTEQEVKQTEKQVSTTTSPVIQTQPVKDIQTTAPAQTTVVPPTSTETATQPVNDDSRVLYPIGKQVSIESYRAIAAASYLIYNDLETSATTTDVTVTTQTTATVPPETTTTTTVTTNDTQIALEKLTQKENRLFGEFQRERAVLLGELSPDAPRLTLDEVVEIIDSSSSFAEICRKLHEAQPLVDYIGGSGITRLEYWFDDKGEQKIYLIMEEESIFYFRFNGADIVYS